MRLSSSLLIAAFLAGCASGGANLNADATNHGVIAGVVKLPSEIADGACDKLSLVAMADGQQVGRTSIRQSRGRCTYEISRVPEDTELTVQVKSDGLSCPNGGTLAIPEGKTVRVKPGVAALYDVAATCGA